VRALFGAGRTTPGSVVGAVLSVAMLLLALAIVHPLTIASLLGQIRPEYAVVALLLNVPVTVVRALRADVAVRHFGCAVPFRRMLAVQLVGQTYSALSPAATGDLVRAYLWKRDQDLPYAQGVAVVSFERVYSLGLMALVAALLVLLPRHGAWAWGLVGLGLSAGTFLPLLAARVPGAVRQSILGRLEGRPLGSRLLRGAGELQALTSDPLLLAKVSALTLTIFALSGLQVLALLVSLGVRVPITQAVAAYTISQVAGIVSVLPFGLGPADIVVAGVLAGYGVTLATSASLAILLRAASTLPTAAAALPAYLLLQRGREVPLRLLGRAAARIES